MLDSGIASTDAYGCIDGCLMSGAQNSVAPYCQTPSARGRGGRRARAVCAFTRTQIECQHHTQNKYQPEASRPRRYESTTHTMFALLLRSLRLTFFFFFLLLYILLCPINHTPPLPLHILNSLCTQPIPPHTSPTPFSSTAQSQSPTRPRRRCKSRPRPPSGPAAEAPSAAPPQSVRPTPQSGGPGPPPLRSR